MAWNQKIIEELSDSIISDFREWYGPTGKCWCEKKKKFVTPDENPKCSECKSLMSQDTRQFRYLHLHDDYKSF